MRKKYYNMQQSGKTVDIMVFGDITSWRWTENDVSGYSFANELAAAGDVEEIVVHINSYGGEVSEGFAVYNTLKNHPAKVTTICDGFACSAASVIFMAGERRIMNPLSALWIHNVQTWAGGDANAHRKAADESDRLTELSKQAYTSVGLNISAEELAAMMDTETWIMPADAVTMGFATEISEQGSDETPQNSARNSLFGLIREALSSKGDPPDPDKPEPDDPEPDDPDTPDEPALDDPDEDDPEEDPDDDPDEDDDAQNAAQKMMRGFLNALINMEQED